jgi:hypothetical protein
VLQAPQELQCAFAPSISVNLEELFAAG